MLKLLAEQQVIKLMNEKGYRFSTYQEFERDVKHILNGSVQQFEANSHNLNVFLKNPRFIGRYYIVRLCDRLEVRTWEVI